MDCKSSFIIKFTEIFTTTSVFNSIICLYGFLILILFDKTTCYKCPNLNLFLYRNNLFSMKVFIIDDEIAAKEKVCALLKEVGAREDYKHSLLISVKDKLVPVSLKDVVCMYSTDRKIQIHVRNGKVFEYSKSLDALMEILDPLMFYRANKQFIVSRQYVEEIIIWFDGRLLLHLPIELPEPLFISKNKAADFKNWMTL